MIPALGRLRKKEHKFEVSWVTKQDPTSNKTKVNI